ncbi:DNA repair protein complementing XP-C cells homolog isoform X2 [Schistocerca gregaria]|uniref:DNA repair protein complementing XP-C cells homolog isoform X2 n=1 Tax=Schistocerca gregaria TaxID=7010 RepID=UPI00211DB328|nr:DNA repair protein complementing XP-C cells homolog isoform X2 [Schistocerca gregaria]
MRMGNSGKRSSLRAASPQSDESPEKMRRMSLRLKDTARKTKSVKNDRSSFHAVISDNDEAPEKIGRKTRSIRSDRSLLRVVSSDNESPEKMRRVSPRQKGTGEKTKSIKKDVSVSMDSDKSTEKIRRMSSRQEGIGRKTRSIISDRSVLCVVSSDNNELPEKMRSVSPRQKGTVEKTKSIKKDRSSLCSVSSDSDESAEKMRRMSPKQEGIGRKTRSIRSDISSLHVAPSDNNESPEKMRRVSPRQKGTGEKAKPIKKGRFSLLSIALDSDESPEKTRGMLSRQEGIGRKTRSIRSDRSLLRVVSSDNESPEKMRRVSPRQKGTGEKTKSIKKDVSVSLDSDKSTEKIRRMSSRQEGTGRKTRSIRSDRSVLCVVSSDNNELPEKMRSVSPRQKGTGEKTKSIKKDVSVSLDSDKSTEKIRRMSSRQEGTGRKTRSIRSDRFVLCVVSSDNNKSPEKMRRVSPRRGTGGKTKSIKNDRSSLHVVTSDSEESLEKIRASSRQIYRGKTAIKNDSISSSDKGYGGSSCGDDADCQGREEKTALDCGVLWAKKRKSEGVPDESSESSSDDFLVPTQSIDLNSDFFKIEKKEVVSDLCVVENSILANINRLSESDDSDDLQHSTADEMERVTSKQGLQEGNDVLKDEHYSAGPLSIRVKDVTGVKSPSVGRRKKTFNAKLQKASDKCSKPEKSQQEKALVKSSHIRVQNDKIWETGKKRLHKIKVETSTPDVSKLDVSQLLALGEGLDPKPKPVRKTKKRNISKNIVESEEEGSSDWEEVDTNTFKGQEIKHTIPKEGIAVTVQIPNMHQKKKKKAVDVAGYVRRQINRVRRDIQILMHKAHLLCWVAHGNYVNKILNSEMLMALSLSLVPSKYCYTDRQIDLADLKRIVQWFSKTVAVQENVDDKQHLFISLLAQFQKKAAKSRKDMVLMFVCVLRSLGINTRLVISLQPLPLKPPRSEISNLTSKKTTSKGKKIKGELKKKAQSGRKKDAPNTSKGLMGEERDSVTEEEAMLFIQEAAAKKVAQSGKSNQKTSSENPVGIRKSDSSRSLRMRRSVIKYADDGDTTDSDEEKIQREQESIMETKIVNTNSTSSKKIISINAEKIIAKDTKGNKASTSCTIAHSFSSESDSTAEIKVQKNQKGKTDRRVLSSDPESDEAPTADTKKKKKKKKKDQCDVWLEVFLESEEKWICVDVYHQQIHCVQELASRASQPVHYVVAWQDDGTIRDVTRRYCPKWHTVTQKLRVDEEWWKESLKPFAGQRTARDHQEDEDLYRQMQDRPMPTTLAEYKNHPLYVLQKDLLRFQAIYPPDAPTLGFVRGHPVYARECVHTLYHREKWLREAKVVRLGETPYKIVGRPRWDRINRKIIKGVPVEYFGPWQVEDYVPPTAVDGKVPRSAYGNVELYKPSMLPGGTVHMQIPGLNRIARKLQIDCAPAFTGFGQTNGIWGPLYDGFVVCEEYKYVLAEAWQAEEEAAETRCEEKRLKRIYGNWRRLIKGLFIRERLKARYNFGPVREINNTKTKTAKRFLKSKRMKTVDSDDSDWEMGVCD